MSPKDSSNTEPDTPDPATQATRPAKVVKPSEDPDELRRQIEETRAELGDTVEALSAKTDVKGQAKAKVDEQKAKVTEAQAQVKENPPPVAAVAGGVVALLLLIIFLRRRG